MHPQSIWPSVSLGSSRTGYRLRHKHISNIVSPCPFFARDRSLSHFQKLPSLLNYPMALQKIQDPCLVPCGARPHHPSQADSAHSEPNSLFCDPLQVLSVSPIYLTHFRQGLCTSFIQPQTTVSLCMYIRTARSFLLLLRIALPLVCKSGKVPAVPSASTAPACQLLLHHLFSPGILGIWRSKSLTTWFLR